VQRGNNILATDLIFQKLLSKIKKEQQKVHILYNVYCMYVYMNLNLVQIYLSISQFKFSLHQNFFEEDYIYKWKCILYFP